MAKATGFSIFSARNAFVDGVTEQGGGEIRVVYKVTGVFSVFRKDCCGCIMTFVIAEKSQVCLSFPVCSKEGYLSQKL